MPVSPAVVSPAMRRSPGREARSGGHKRGCSLESGMVFKERDDDLALFNEVQSKERDGFLLQDDDDFEDVFVTKLRHFSDHKIGLNVAARGESSDLLNAEEEKNDYEWLMTPPETPLFPSLDDETPRVIPAQRGRPRAQPISISRSSTMEKSHRSSRGSPSPNRLSPSPRSHEPTFQPRTRATSAPSSSPPPTRRPATGSRRPSSPSSKPSSPPPRASTPTSRRLSTGSTSTTRGISVNSASPKIRAWQANIPGFSTEAPPNLRTSLADRPASYVRGSSPASRNGRKSMSPTAPRSIGSSHSRGSVANYAADDDVESLPSVTLDGSERSNSRRVIGFRNNTYNKVPSPQKPSRTVTSSSAPKRSFDMALRQMDHRKTPQNMFRPLLSSVPTSNFYAGKSSPAWNSSVTTSSNASSDFGTSGPHDIEENERNVDEATSGITKVPDSNVNDEAIFMFEKTDSLNEDIRPETHDISPNKDFSGNLVQHDTATSVNLDDYNGQDDTLVCSRCGCEYSVITETEDNVKLCLSCRKSTSDLTVASSEADSTMSDKDHEFVNKTLKPQLTLAKDESPELTCKDESQSELAQVNHDEISQPSSSYSDTRGEQIQNTVNTVDFPKSKDEPLEREGISTILKRSSSMKGPVTRSRNFSASSISYDALSYMSASSSVDFGPRLQSQLSSRRSDTENYKYDPVNVKHRRSVSSLSGTSSHAFHPSSVGTRSTLDPFEVSIVREDRDVADSASVGLQENPSENDTCNENVDSGEVMLPELVNQPSSLEVSVVLVERDAADSASVGPQENPSENNTCTENADSASVGPQENPSENDTCTENTDSALKMLPELVNQPSSLEVSVVLVERDAADSASVGPQENPSENNTCTENADSASVGPQENPSENDTCTENADSASVGPQDTNTSMTCAVEEGTSLTPGVDSNDVTEVSLGALSEGEVDRTSSSSPASQCHSSQHSESSIEACQDLQDSHVTVAVSKDTAVSGIEFNTSNHSSSIVEESMVLVEGQEGTKGRSLTLEEATDTILFCSSIVHNLAYEAANIAIEKETPSEPLENNDYQPLVPAATKSYSGRKYLQSRKTSKRSLKSQKTRRKTMEGDTMKAPNSINTGEETDVPKPRIVYSNNKENTKPPPVLESKCNCSIM